MTAALTPRTPCFLLAASPSTKVVEPPKATEANGRTCFSAAAAGIEMRSSATASPTRGMTLLGEEFEEELRERRGQDIAVGQIEGFRQPVAVGEQHQRQRACRQRHDERRRRVVALPERPHDFFAVEVLHEPAE